MADLWEELGSARARTQAAESRSQAASKRAQTKLRAARERLAAGESTGNLLKDYVIKVVGFSEETLAKLQALDSDLRANVGGLILLVEHDERFHGCTGFGGKARPSDYVRQEYLTLGVIDEGGLEVSREGQRLTCALPLEAWVGCEVDRMWGDPPKLERSTETWRPYGGYRDFVECLDVPITYQNPLSRYDDDKRFEVVISEIAVRGRFVADDDQVSFSLRPSVTLFQRLAEALGQAVPSTELAAEREAAAREAIPRLESLLGQLGGETGRSRAQIEEEMQEGLEALEAGGLGDRPLAHLIREKLSITTTSQ